MEQNELTVKLTIGQIINKSVKIYKDNFIHFLNLSIIFILPVLFITVFSIDAVIEYSKVFVGFDISKLNSSFFKIFSYIILISMLEGIIFYFYKCTIIQSADFLIRNEKPTAIKSIAEVLRLFFPIFITSILTGLMVFFGFILFIIPGIILAGMLVFVPQIMILEKKFYFHSFDRSFFIIKKNFWETITLFAIIYLVYYFISSIFTSIITIHETLPAILKSAKTGETAVANPEIMNKWVQLATQSVTYLVFILIMPVLHIAATIKFQNIKYLKEGTGIIDELNKE